MNRKKKLKLYVWEDVLCDYTDGMALAFATSKEHALKLFNKAGLQESRCAELRTKAPKVVSTAKAFYVYGGG